MVEGEGRPPDEGITRRDALKRGAALAGAIAWATPVVQLVGIRPAMAHSPSPEFCHVHLTPTICLEFDQEVCACIDACEGDENCELNCLVGATIRGTC